jgi:methionyl-tRNA synthetase
MISPHLVPKDTILTIIGEYIKSLRSYDTQKAFSNIRELLDEANSMLNTTEPWKKSGEEKGRILVE